MEATGVVKPVSVFEQDANGRWKNTGRQETNNAGVPLWEVGVSWLGADRYGEIENLTYEVIVASRTQPVVGRNHPVAFEGLTLGYYLNRNKMVIVETLSASAVVEAD